MFQSCLSLHAASCSTIHSVEWSVAAFWVNTNQQWDGPLPCVQVVVLPYIHMNGNNQGKTSSPHIGNGHHSVENEINFISKVLVQIMKKREIKKHEGKK